MFNCKRGDIAVITWDEAPVFSNIGKLVRVVLDAGYEPGFGLLWFIKPINYSDNHLFIDGRDNGIVKLRLPSDNDINHPDAWLRPLKDTDNSFEELMQEIVRNAEKIKCPKELVTEACD